MNSIITVNMTQQLPPERRYAPYTLELTDPTDRISATSFGSCCFSSVEFALYKPWKTQYNDALFYAHSIKPLKASLYGTFLVVVATFQSQVWQDAVSKMSWRWGMTTQSSWPHHKNNINLEGVKNFSHLCTWKIYNLHQQKELIFGTIKTWQHLSSNTCDKMPECDAYVARFHTNLTSHRGYHRWQPRCRTGNFKMPFIVTRLSINWRKTKVTTRNSIFPSALQTPVTETSRVIVDKAFWLISSSIFTE